MNKLKLIVLSIILLLLFSCEKKIEFDLNKQENSRLVVEGNLTDQTKEHIVKLTRTSSYYESEPAPFETGATVSIYNGTTYHQLTEISPGIYKTAANYTGEVGKTYTLSITTSNNQEYSASSTIYPVTQIDTIITQIEDPIKGEGGSGPDVKGMILSLNHYGPEPSTLGNNYMWMVFLNGTNLTPLVTDIYFENDEFVNGNYINDLAIHQIDEFDPILSADTLRFTVELHSISREYYDFLTAIIIETEFNGGLFAGPPANIPSNISNNGLGFFRASAVYSKYIELKNPLIF
jgi:hypothetical protein